VLPVWLQYPAADEQLTSSLITWVQAPDWPASRTYLLDNATSLLTDPAEAALEHLIDANPALSELRDHLELLRSACVLGPAGAYDAQQEQDDAEYRTELLSQWLRTRTWRASQDFATANADALLKPATQVILAGYGDNDLRHPELRLHRGLLGYAAIAGLEAAYGVRGDPGLQASILDNPATPLTPV
jgi:hypothetical protein